MVDRGLYMPSLEPEGLGAVAAMVRCCRDYGLAPTGVK